MKQPGPRTTGSISNLARNILWSVVGVVGIVISLGILYLAFLATLFGGAALGLWHLHIEDR
ncbi:MAG TPA: hypothetical protein VIJ21_00075 [Solirubrobacterales bacterium]